LSAGQIEGGAGKNRLHAETRLSTASVSDRSGKPEARWQKAMGGLAADSAALRNEEHAQYQFPTYIGIAPGYW
jgi:hypothetical protein